MNTTSGKIEIAIKGLRKSYGDTIALDGIDLNIPSGRCYGFLGPNGAGKTTAMSIISTYLPADAGEITVGGIDAAKNPSGVRRMLGVVPQEASLYEDLSARENILFFGGLYGIDKAKLSKKTSELIDLLGLKERADEQVKRYSGGMKRRLNIACSIAHDPPIVLMDEPTVGIDPQSRNFIYEFIEGLSAQGRTIVYTSHYMEEVERLCHRVAIIDHGRIIAEGTKDELIEMVRGEDVVIIELGDIAADVLKPMLDKYAKLSPIHEDGGIRFTGPGIHKDVPAFIKDFIDMGMTPKSLHIHEPNLETVFLKLTGRELRD